MIGSKQKLKLVKNGRVLTRSKFDILREKLSPSHLPISDEAREKAEAILRFLISQQEKMRDEIYDVNGINKLTFDESMAILILSILYQQMLSSSLYQMDS